MRVIKKEVGRGITAGLMGLVLVLGAGCKPPGERALLSGGELIREGKYEEAVKKLELATRLMPTNALAFNHLGLAYHGNQQPNEAHRAYEQALSLDHELAAAHYNLGTLFLEQGNARGAVDELTSYTLLEPGLPDGWLQLGSARLRVEQLDGAEKAYQEVLRQEPSDAAALNGLGMVQAKRKRSDDALFYFNKALTHEPVYRPALLNLAVLAQQDLKNLPLALEKYNEYLALQPRPSNWDEVAATARRLELELEGGAGREPVAKSRRGGGGAPPAVALDTRGTAAASNSMARTSALPRVLRSGGVGPGAGEGSVQVPAKSSTEGGARQEPTARSAGRAVPERGSAVKPGRGGGLERVPKPVNPARSSKEQKGGAASNYLSRLVPTPRKEPVRLTPVPKAPVSEPSKPVVERQPVRRRAGPVSTRRYTYMSPSRGRGGNRGLAERYFGSGLEAQKAGLLSKAVLEYRKATQADPGYYEAYYNLGLAAYHLRNWKEALAAYEHALAEQPDSMDARYNFSLALRAGDYPADAVRELLRVVRSHPGETRAHLLLANTYDQGLNQPRMARAYYLKILEIAPNHPDAAKIRYWLSQNE